MSMLAPHLQTIVDSVCERGCSETDAFIADLENGRPREETLQISDSERTQVLEELKSIMLVYHREYDN